MISTRLIKGFAALSLGVGVQSQGASSNLCAETITARTGDTCASLSEFAGISVSQFLQSNPQVKSCGTLVGGAVYCKKGATNITATPVVPANLPPFRSPAVSASPSPSPSSVRPTRDGTCGGNVTCTGSRYGPCCSLHGFCGISIDYCGEGCQVGLGQCGDVVPSETVPILSIITVVATSTVRITDTVTATLLPSTASTTSKTSTPPTTLTTSTKATSPTSKPTRTLPRTPNNCKTYDEILSSDTCETIATRNDIDLRDFYRLNPAINTVPSFPGPPFADPLGLLCRVDCEDLWEGYYVCTSVAAERGFGPGFGPGFGTGW
ncbi:hypothetical protein B0T14DRAFT_432971 [Immersiella caudata]|uniref:Carbohydrate-binding module family 18 protein n=1 Tax=Immersiella caudata TaxID=314043 RepID=A0AA39WQQ3_9PEZI|nr:hypothetical protein B0T14DRAFT_432971 [Immersiella caudata]